MTKIHKKAIQSKPSVNESVSEVSPEEGINKKGSRLCPWFSECSAPLCPLDESSLKRGVWYPDEETCRLQSFCNLKWIKNQKKIASRAQNVFFYFTLEMLNHNCIIRKGIEGLDPDNTEINDRRAIKLWIKEHPEIKEYSPERRESIKKNGESYRRDLTSLKNKPQHKGIKRKVPHLTRKLDQDDEE